jgi:DivIVA domain-containing protein
VAENFTKTFRGYSVEEVDDAIDDLESEIEKQKAEIESLKEQLHNAKEENAIIQNQSSITEKANEEIARLALKEASDLITKAKRNANMILKESMDYVKGLDKEVNGFKDDAKTFRAEVVNLSKELIETIDKSEIFALINEDENAEKETDHN